MIEKIEAFRIMSPQMSQAFAKVVLQLKRLMRIWLECGKDKRAMRCKIVQVADFVYAQGIVLTLRDQPRPGPAHPR